MEDDKVHLTNAQWHALREMVVVKGRRVFYRSQLKAADDRVVEALLRKGALATAGAKDRLRLTDAGAEAVERAEALYERQSRG
jgi:hypothetical protein